MTRTSLLFDPVRTTVQETIPTHKRKSHADKINNGPKLQPVPFQENKILKAMDIHAVLHPPETIGMDITAVLHTKPSNTGYIPRRSLETTKMDTPATLNPSSTGYTPRCSPPERIEIDITAVLDPKPSSTGCIPLCSPLETIELDITSLPNSGISPKPSSFSAETGGISEPQHPRSDLNEPDKPSLIEKANQCPTSSLPLTTADDDQSGITLQSQSSESDNDSQSDSALGPASPHRLVEINDMPVAISCCHSPTGRPPSNDHSAAIDEGWKCSFCFKSLKDSDLIQHLAEHFTEQFAEDVAKVAEKYAEHFSKHILDCAKAKYLKRPHMDCQSTLKERVGYHAVTTAIDNGWKCSSCETVLKDSDIISHVVKHKADCFKNYKKCPRTHCQDTFASRAELVYHLKYNCNTVYPKGDETTINKGWNCAFCEKNFKYSDIDLHIEEHFLNGCHALECFYLGCNFSAKYKGQYWNHMFAHADPYVCPAPACSETFTTRTLLQCHARKKHCGKRVFRCDRESCNKGWDWIWQLQTHKKDKHSISPINKRQRLR